MLGLGKITTTIITSPSHIPVSYSRHSIVGSHRLLSKRKKSYSIHSEPPLARHLTFIPVTFSPPSRSLSTTTVKMSGDSIPSPNITLDNMNPNVKGMEYAVRGPLVIRAGQIEREIREGNKKHPFAQ